MLPRVSGGHGLLHRSQRHPDNHILTALCQPMDLESRLSYVMHTGVSLLPALINGKSRFNSRAVCIVVINRFQYMLCQ